MSFDKDYPNRKDHRKPYRDSRRFDGTCRNNKDCPYCKGNRLYQYNKQIEKTNIDLEDYKWDH